VEWGIDQNNRKFKGWQYEKKKTQVVELAERYLHGGNFRGRRGETPKVAPFGTHRGEVLVLGGSKTVGPVSAQPSCNPSKETRAKEKKQNTGTAPGNLPGLKRSREERRREEGTATEQRRGRKTQLSNKRANPEGVAAEEGKD